MLDEFFKNLPETLSNLPNEPHSLISLIVVVLGVVAIALFRNSPPAYSLASFTLLLLGFIGFVFSVQYRDNGSGSASGDDIAPETRSIAGEVQTGATVSPSAAPEASEDRSISDTPLLDAIRNYESD